MLAQTRIVTKALHVAMMPSMVLHYMLMLLEVLEHRLISKCVKVLGMFILPPYLTSVSHS